MENIEYEFFNDLVTAMAQKQIAGTSHDMVVNKIDTQTNNLLRGAETCTSS